MLGLLSAILALRSAAGTSLEILNKCVTEHYAQQQQVGCDPIRFQKRNERETLSTDRVSLRRFAERIDKALRAKATSNAPSKIIGFASNESPGALSLSAEALMKWMGRIKRVIPKRAATAGLIVEGILME